MKKKSLLLLLLAVLFLAPVSAKKYKADWEDLNTYPQAEWLRNLKFGMYWHWSLGSIPGNSGWYGRNMYKKNSTVYKYHVENYGDPKTHGYVDFIKDFTADKFSAEQWVDDAYKIGARFIVGMGVHHDGFELFNDPYNKYNSVNMNPHIDIMGELQKEAEKRGMKFGVTSHLAFHWQFFSMYMWPDKSLAAAAPDFYNLQDPNKEPNEKWVKQWYKRTKYLIDNYNLDFLWFDFGTREKPYFKYTPKITADFYNQGEKHHKQVALATKYGFFNPDSQIYDAEHGKFSYIRKPMWMADCTFNYKWFNVHVDEDPYSTTGKFWLYQLIDIVSKNGTLLLNLGPNADGSWNPEWKAELMKVGKWLDVNGQAIYNTRAWHRFGEGPTNGGDGRAHLMDDNLTANDVRFTTKGDTLYAIVCGWHSRPFLIKSLSSMDIPGLKIKKVEMLGYDKKINWSAGKDGLTLTYPSKQFGEYAYVFKITGENMFPKREEYETIEVNMAEMIPNVKEIRIQLPRNNEQLNLSEIYTFGRRKHNIAMYGQGIASSLAQNEKTVSAPLYALFDNHVNGNPILRGVVSTKVSNNPWIGVKFDKAESFDGVQIFTKMGTRSKVFNNANLIFIDKNGKEVLNKKLKDFVAEESSQDHLVK